MIFEIAWYQHGGSGLQASVGDIKEMDLDEAEWYAQRIGDERKREARILKAEARKSRR